ncbi:MAG TPA: hypothetical protein VIU11_29245 [Nakamurella sp.]
MGNGGLDWDTVHELIVDKLVQVPDVEVQLFSPTRVRHELVGRPVRMTWGRATVIRLIESYDASRAITEPWSGGQGVSALEIQKLMYFANLVAPSLKLKFSQGKYGPYSEQVRHQIQDMEGSFLRGYGDGAAPVLDLDPIGPTEAGSEQARRLDARRSDEIAETIVDPTIALLEGFEGPYGLELLASVHWVRAHEDRSNDPISVTAHVQQWSERKGRLFTQDHVAQAMKRLDLRSATASPKFSSEYSPSCP